MNQPYEKEAIIYDNKDFKNVNYTEEKLRDGEFYQRDFINCNFSKSNLSKSIFEDCTFKNCNLSMIKINGVGFREVSFVGCKIMGIDFTDCNQFMFSFGFDQCILDYSTFLRD